MELTALGLSDDAESVYLALLTRNPALLAERKQSLGKAHYRRAVESLLDCRLITTAEAGDLKPMSPVVALEALIEKRGQDLVDHHREILACRSAIDRFHQLYDQARDVEVGDADPDVQQVFGLEAIRESLAELAFFARTTVMSVQPGGPQSAEAIEASRPLDHRAIGRGLEMRVVHERAVLGDELNRGFLRELTELGVQARVSDSDLDRMVIFDNEVAVVPHDPHDSRAGALIVRQAGLVSGFVGLFERLWELSEELPWESAEDGPAELESQILKFLAEGATDEQIARELTISVRHLRRHISQLMGRLEAGSRFEAGVEASRRGWI